MMWKCPKCGYLQDFSPNNKEKMSKVFNLPKKEISGNCPACQLSLKGKKDKDFAKKFITKMIEQ